MSEDQEASDIAHEVAENDAPVEAEVTELDDSEDENTDEDEQAEAEEQ